MKQLLISFQDFRSICSFRASANQCVHFENESAGNNFSCCGDYCPIYKKYHAPTSNSAIKQVTPAVQPAAQPGAVVDDTRPDEICDRCGGSGMIYMGYSDGDGRTCPSCHGEGRKLASNSVQGKS